ncbi:hypothetical protein DSM19430T_18580 [Desulfovibrio psychrotolerans]|uniref:Uncharacterized protein n=1 Tax=Desulfovibrio psychrotolerans TaxID=415242 RepID=A0A7J0BW15_9BACT|nr:hypothetical protein DSM19430T_18580 [Desulfovibrio psychrotolerans]
MKESGKPEKSGDLGKLKTACAGRGYWQGLLAETYCTLSVGVGALRMDSSSCARDCSRD